MSSQTTPSAGRASRLRRAGVLGFATGFAAAIVVTMLALMTPVAEAVHPVLVPAVALLGPLADRLAHWNGLLSMSLAGVVNGAVYAAVFVLAGVVTGRRPRRAGGVEDSRGRL